ncbi:hypothetical protein HYG93_05785 [Acinetobacter sp. SwsAc6]|uniref:hypothetical protein n=1 Tax=Acinetobacter sp. SwsAc6 TaxID=2749439 RepID=UPI0015BFC6A5|nr:hypothetical protein [Acinetobacter sp. SwsAc6]NWK73808.1 hypothetical protein [Acinetobacter sp. SwsAc6]
MNKLKINDVLTYIPIITLIPLIIGIFYKVGYLLLFDLQFLISSFSYTELALSSYSSILFALVSLYSYSIMKLNFLEKITWKFVIFINLVFISTHYLPIFDMTFFDLVLKLLFLNILIFFNITKSLIVKSVCIFMALVVAPAVNGMSKNYEFPKEASNKIMLKGDSTEWYLVEKVSDTLVLVDKDTLVSRDYRYKFVELKNVEQMESKLWQNLKKAP